MRRSAFRAFLRLSLPVLLLGACATPPPPRAPESGPRIELGALELALEEQASALKLDSVATVRLRQAVESLLRDPSFRHDAEQYTINAVGWFQMGEGGAVVKFADGRGAVGAEQRPFNLRAWTVGAQIGGSASRGVLVVIGLEHESNFVGDYVAEGTRATAVTESTRKPLLLRSKAQGHLVYVVDVSTGLSADAGVGRVRVKWR